MCFGKQPKPTELAEPPAPPLEPAEAPQVGDTRRKETQDNFGDDAPNYRVNRQTATKPVNPDGKIVM